MAQHTIMNIFKSSRVQCNPVHRENKEEDVIWVCLTGHSLLWEQLPAKEGRSDQRALKGHMQVGESVIQPDIVWLVEDTEVYIPALHSSRPKGEWTWVWDFMEDPAAYLINAQAAPVHFWRKVVNTVHTVYEEVGGILKTLKAVIPEFENITTGLSDPWAEKAYMVTSSPQLINWNSQVPPNKVQSSFPQSLVLINLHSH